MNLRKNILLIGVLSLFIITLICHLSIGYSGDLLDHVIELFSATKQFSPETHLLMDFRFPRLCTAIFSGAALAVSGMLMQTIFRNMLAGPYVLGISSGSSLFVLLFLLFGGAWFGFQSGMLTSAIIGAIVFGFIILMFTAFVRTAATLLLVGVMLGSLTSGLTAVLDTYATAEELRTITFWSMGSLQYVENVHLSLFGGAIFALIGLTYFLARSLDAFVLGELHASALGVNVRVTRILSILVSSVLTGVTVAFCGPISFVGLAVPNCTRLLLNSQKHRLMIVVNCIVGATFMLLADCLILSLEGVVSVPVNAMTAILGAPFVIYLLIRKGIME